MRILLNGLLAGNGSGTGRYIIELCRALSREPDAAQRCRFLWPETLPIPADIPRDACALSHATSLRRILMEQNGLRAYAQQIQADALHYPASIGPVHARHPVILTVHDMCCFRHPEWFSRSRAWYYRATMAPGIRRADRIIADSESTAEDIVAFTGVPRSRIQVVYLGVDEAFKPADSQPINALREAYGLPQEFFLFVGTLEPRKNLPRLINAWAKVADQTPDLVIAGRIGWKMSQDLCRHAAGNHADHIHFLGHVPQDQLPALYSAAQALLWPSLMEGFGLPPLEAMACATPVLTSNTSSLPEIAGNAALLVNPTSVSEMADAIRALHQDHALRKQLIAFGLEQASRFTWQRTAQETLRVYEM